jgi:hypothetical protein
MANAFLNMARTTTCPDLVRRVLQAARLSGTKLSDFDFLGSTELAAKKSFVDILNDGTRDTLTRLPVLNRLEIELTITAGQRHVLLPATLRFNEIMAVYWGEDEDSLMAGKPIVEWGTVEVERASDAYRNPNYSCDWPEAYSVADINYGSDQGAILFYPLPATERTIRVRYRALEAKWTIRDLRTAVATASVSAGAVNGFTITDGGEAYTSNPTVVISGDGAGATGTATVTNTRVSSMVVTAGGAGYTSSDNIIVEFQGGKTASPVPDDCMEVLDHACAYRLMRKSTGAGGIAWKELEAIFNQLAGEWAIKLAQSNASLKDATHGFEGHPRPGLNDPFGVLGNLSLGDYYG